MGQSFEDILVEARKIGAGARIGVTVATNQDNGIASYAVGELLFQPAHDVGGILLLERLSTVSNAPLQYFFSDRKLDIDPPPEPGTFKHLPRQPFSANATDKLGLSISQQLPTESSPKVEFTLLSFGNTAFTVAVESSGNVLVGVGAPIGNNTTQAVYIVSFQGVNPPPPPIN